MAMSPVVNVAVEFKVVQCHLSHLRKGRVALSNLRVKGPTEGDLAQGRIQEFSKGGGGGGAPHWPMLFLPPPGAPVLH